MRQITSARHGAPWSPPECQRTRSELDTAARARDQAIDLLVTDLQMPGMSGLDLATHLRERHADLPVVLMSGWSEATAFELAQPFVFLRKPFPLQGLFGAIGSLFADRPNPVPVPGGSQG